MKAPRLLKRESISSFRARVAAWEKSTGKKYPKSGWGTREEKYLSNKALIGMTGPTKDYSQDYIDEIKEFESANIKLPDKKDRDEQAIADIRSGKVNPYTMDLPGKKQLVIDKRLAEIDAADKKRLDDARKAENQEIRDQVALDKETNPWGIDNIRRATGMEVGRTNSTGGALYIPKNIPSDKQDQSGMGKGVKPIGTYKSDTGELDREAWLKKTANSPAAKAGMSDDMRWQARQSHVNFQNKRKNKKKLSIKD